MDRGDVPTGPVVTTTTASCPPALDPMEVEYDSSSEDGEFLWTAVSRLKHPQCGGKPSRTCKDFEPRRSHKPSFRSRSAPPSSTPSLSRHPDHTRTLPPLQGIMLAAPTIDLNFDNDVDDDWMPPPSSSPRLYRAASVGNSWGVTSIGRGCVWNNHNRGDESESEPTNAASTGYQAELLKNRSYR